jgi:molecular chaperone DnaK
MATWATEKAKIELLAEGGSGRQPARDRTGCQDESGEEIYIDIAVDRERYDD